MFLGRSRNVFNRVSLAALRSANPISLLPALRGDLLHVEELQDVVIWRSPEIEQPILVPVPAKRGRPLPGVVHPKVRDPLNRGLVRLRIVPLEASRKDDRLPQLGRERDLLGPHEVLQHRAMWLVECGTVLC